MPEGPEVAVVAKILNEVISNKTIIKIITDERSKVKGFDKIVYPLKISSCTSHGKRILMNCIDGSMIVTHLNMNGRYQYQPGKHTHTTIIFDDGFMLYFDDQRYRGYIQYLLPDEINNYFSRFGPDILKTEVSFEEWAKIFSIRKIQNWTIRKTLLDQTIIQGIGNYLVSEICYYSALYPDRIMSTLSKEHIERMRVVSHHIIRYSFSCGGCTLKDFISPNGQIGLYKPIVYDRENEKDPNGYLIIRQKAKDGRSSYFCPAVQGCPLKLIIVE